MAEEMQAEPVLPQFQDIAEAYTARRATSRSVGADDVKVKVSSLGLNYQTPAASAADERRRSSRGSGRRISSRARTSGRTRLSALAVFLDP